MKELLLNEKQAKYLYIVLKNVNRVWIRCLILKKLNTIYVPMVVNFSQKIQKLLALVVNPNSRIENL